MKWIIVLILFFALPAFAQEKADEKPDDDMCGVALGMMPHSVNYYDFLKHGVPKDQLQRDWYQYLRTNTLILQMTDYHRKNARQLDRIVIVFSVLFALMIIGNLVAFGYVVRMMKGLRSKLDEEYSMRTLLSPLEDMNEIVRQETKDRE